ncbi:GntR family transcriptional regulator [Paenibacillus sp. GCM10012306]|uniref:GntR family transcriptional regulator n=1 Tax=Paenibacillus sp. GCM10012306 TaxID=3317342 RepID=UPI00361C9D0A
MSLSRQDRPLYLQIKHILKERILYGVYPLGSIIPSEPNLEKEFAVSKITVRGAVQELVQEGFLEKGSGRGTKVIRNKEISRLSKWKHFTEILVEAGHTIRKEWLRAEVHLCVEGSEPYRLFGERCLKLDRIFFLNDAPYIYYTHYLSMTVEELELSSLSGRSLYDWLEEQGILPDRLRDEFAVALAPPEVKENLRLPGNSHVLKRTRYSFNEQGTAMEWSIGYYNTELQSYVADYDV